ncbi:MAG: FixH family protein [Pseudomonadota bacterium]
MSVEKQAFRFTGKHMALLMISFFGIIISVNLSMAILASKSWTGLVVKNSYVASQQFNHDLIAANEQKASGLYSDLEYMNGVLRFTLFDVSGSAIPANKLLVQIGRPAFEQQDRQTSFDTYNNNTGQLSLNLQPGIWAVKITGNVEKRNYRRDARFLVDLNGNGRIQ